MPWRHASLEGSGAWRRSSASFPSWRTIAEHHLEKNFKFRDFKGALAFVNRIGAVAEEQGHHPDICFGWGSVKVTLFTHKVKGLTESDFILAAKVDQVFSPGAN